MLVVCYKLFRVGIKERDTRYSRGYVCVENALSIFGCDNLDILIRREPCKDTFSIILNFKTRGCYKFTFWDRGRI